MKQIYLHLLIGILFFTNPVNATTCALAPPTTNYYSITDGAYSTLGVWSLASHAGASCVCAPSCSLPSNSHVWIAHTVVASCDISTGSNSSLNIQNGGDLQLTGNFGLSGSGTFNIHAGATATINGDIDLSGGGTFTIDGDLVVNGNVNFNSGSSSICGGGSITVTGSIGGSNVCGMITVLPVELLRFEAIYNQGNVELNWTTGSEVNNSHFDIQRSSNGIEFETISTVYAAGSTTSITDYMEMDYNPFSGMSYYRLKQVDYDGEEEIFTTIPVQNLESNESTFSIFPNPVSKENEQVNLLLEGFINQEVLVVMRDLVGREYYSKIKVVKSGSKLEVIPIDVNIPTGVYLITASSNNSVYSKRLIIR